MADKDKTGFSELAKQASLQPQEMLAEVKKGEQSTSIGVPKETTYQENRVTLTPSSVELLVNNGLEVTIEANAGKGANFADRQYSEAGAKIAYDRAEVYRNSDIILKVDPPVSEEIELMKPNQLLISALQLANLKEDYIKQLMKKKVNAMAYEFYRDASGSIPIIRSISEIAGSTAILIAAEYLASSSGGKGEMLGGISGIPPTEVVIIGAGTVGEFACRAALGLGASVKVFDNSLYKLRRLQNNIGERIFTSVIQPNILLKALKIADVAVGALRSDSGVGACVVTEEMVMGMKPGSVIVDVSIDRGGCFETSESTTHTSPTFRKHDVIHYCVPNISSRVARTASYALSNVLAPLILQIAESGGVDRYVWDRPAVRSGIYVYKGLLTNKHIAARLNLQYKSIDLLMGGHL
ncbi:MAG: alanine dehydrogenase [Flavobacteriaceae bacterium]|nr:alanine dehydrogenase [Flavobacteriaceae bacterium]